VASDLRESWENLGNPITECGAADWLAVGAAEKAARLAVRRLPRRENERGKKIEKGGGGE